MDTNQIDLISSYCDRWCERCAFTSRCSLFHVQAAIGMCGDAAEGIELAVGTPYPEEPSETAFPAEDWAADLETEPMSRAEAADFDLDQQESDARLDETTIVKIAEVFSILAQQWLT